jgi:long-chain acyl-CoA synthetase
LADFSMQTEAQRPWLSLYRGVRSELAPPSETALDMFRKTLARDAGAPFVHYFERTLTVGELDTMSDALAVGLQQRGVEVGDRVAVYLQNVPQVVIAVLAIWKCGAVVVPCNPMLRERELGKILRSSGCLAMICHEDLYADVGRAALPATAVRHTITTSQLEFLEPGKPLPAMLSGVRRNRQPDTSDMLEIVERHAGERPKPVELTGDDVAFMVHTSGTTGDAKGAMNTHRNVVFATSVYEA